MMAADTLGDLLGYPRQPLPARVRRAIEDLRGSHPAVADALDRFDDAIRDLTDAEIQEEYSFTFDFTPACTLELGWHLFGESHARGRFLAGIREELQRAGVAESAGLPDHLAHLLPLLARADPQRAAGLAAMLDPALTSVRTALAGRPTPFVHLLDAAIRLIAGMVVPATPEERVT
jgi:nitrate reductase molybdenum cofactor assembly chaperone